MIPQLTPGCSVTATKSSSSDDSVNVVFGEVFEEVDANSSHIAQLVYPHSIVICILSNPVPDNHIITCL